MPQRSLLRDIPAEDILAQASADGHVIVVTNDALTVASHDRLRLDVPIEEVRRIQFDIERERPATLVIVRDAPSSEPQVIMVQPDEYERVGHALAVLGMKMATMAD
jgi:predicted membrane GTPase involved in stress response